METKQIKVKKIFRVLAGVLSGCFFLAILGELFLAESKSFSAIVGTGSLLILFLYVAFTGKAPRGHGEIKIKQK